jgi:hypothetical protein
VAAKSPPPLGLLAEFPDQDALLGAVRSTRKAGYRDIDAFSPYPVEGMPEAMGQHTHRMGWLSVFGGLFGFFGALLVQVLTNWNYPINVGGRPILAWAAFVVVDFELMVLFAVLFPAFGMIYCNGLPRLYHPLFGTPRFNLATDDRFFLYIGAADRKFHPKETRAFLRSLKPASIEAVLE